MALRRSFGWADCNFKAQVMADVLFVSATVTERRGLFSPLEKCVRLLRMFICILFGVIHTYIFALPVCGCAALQYPFHCAVNWKTVNPLLV